MGRHFDVAVLSRRPPPSCVSPRRELPCALRQYPHQCPLPTAPTDTLGPEKVARALAFLSALVAHCSRGGADGGDGGASPTAAATPAIAVVVPLPVLAAFGDQLLRGVAVVLTDPREKPVLVTAALVRAE